MRGNVAALADICVKRILPAQGGFLALGLHCLCLLCVLCDKVDALRVLAAPMAATVVQVGLGQGPPTADKQST